MSPNPSALVFWALLTILVFAIVSRLVRKPYPIVMLAGGALLALIPGLPQFALAPDVVFLIMLPLVLFGDAWTTDFRAFKAQLLPILWLALGLVVVTTVALAQLAHAWFGLPLAVGYVLGAILSPSDAIATEAIAEEISFPRTAETILSGESLVNDAAALVIYAFAVESVVRGTFSLTGALLDFAYVVIAGLAIGVAVAAIMYFVSLTLRRLRLSNELIGTLVSVVTPFLCYLPAQAAQASGVLASVGGGVFLSARSSEIFDADERIAAAGVWQLVLFCLNGLAFILIGLQLRSALSELSAYRATTLFAYALGVAALIIGIRFAAVFGGGTIRWRILRKRGLVTGAPAYGNFLITSWAGMRGIVTLAGALSIPVTTASGAPFPGRALILYLAFTTIVITLVGQGLTLPALVRRFGAADTKTFNAEVALAQIRAAEAARDRLRELEASFTTTKEWEAAGRLISLLDERTRRARAKLDGLVESESPVDAAVLSSRHLQLEMALAEREALDRSRRSGEITDRAFRHVQYEIDLAQSLVRQNAND